MWRRDFHCDAMRSRPYWRVRAFDPGSCIRGSPAPWPSGHCGNVGCTRTLLSGQRLVHFCRSGRRGDEIAEFCAAGVAELACGLQSSIQDSALLRSDLAAAGGEGRAHVQRGQALNVDRRMSVGRRQPLPCCDCDTFHATPMGLNSARVRIRSIVVRTGHLRSHGGLDRRIATGRTRFCARTCAGFLVPRKPNTLGNPRRTHALGGCTRERLPRSRA